MSEKWSDTYPISGGYESQADWELAMGNYGQSRHTMLAGIRQEYLRSPKSFHHLAVKLCTSPFYQLVKHGSSPELTSEGEAVYGYLGNLLDFQLQQLNLLPNSSRDKSSLVGDISEAVFLSLSARQFTDGSSHLLLPASKLADTASGSGIDFHYQPIKGQGIGQVDIQAKTRLTPTDITSYDGYNIRLIGLNQIDKHYGYQLHPESLSRTMIRELNGLADEDDWCRLEQATANMEALLGI